MSANAPESPEELQAQIKALQARLQAAISGQGAIAQGEDATAVAATASGSTAIGRVQGNVYIGPAINDPTLALRYYRQVIAGLSQHIPLRALDRTAGDAETKSAPLSLSGIYIDLETTTRVEAKEETEGRVVRIEAEQTRPLRALEAVIAQPRLVLLGDPGSGKSTFVNHLAYCLASHTLEPEAGWLAHLPGWPESEAKLLPVVVTLRDFARRHAGGETGVLPDRAEPKHLWEFINSWLADKNLAFAATPLEEQLQQGRALVLLDGLDEVPSVAQRCFVRDAVIAFMERYPGSRYLVTCRTLAYQPPPPNASVDLRLPANIPSYELAPFDKSRINDFIKAWYSELARSNVVKPEEEAGFIERLQQAVRRPDLWRLASNPLLLTVMALIHTYRGRLPDARALLYEETIDILLWRWDESKNVSGAELPRLRQLLQEAGRADTDLKRALRELAYYAHTQAEATDDPNQPADIGELKLQKTLAALKTDEAGQPDLTWANRLIEVMKLRAGLLLERAPEVFTFPHRTFQEYLAGAHLAGQADFAQQGAKLAAAGNVWREAILLAVGYLVYKVERTDCALALVGELCPNRCGDAAAAWQKVWLAGDALLEVGLKRAQDSELGRDLLERVRGRLAKLLTGGKLSARERAQAGNTLAVLGDPRPGVRLRADGLPDIIWREVPAGPFLMGSDKEKDPQAYDDEQPQHQIDLPRFLISRYPITNAQFVAFVDAGGYKQGAYWPEAEAEGFWQPGQVQDMLYYLDDDKKLQKKTQGWREGPYKFGTPFNLPNHPVVGISWYEALAFCRWLEEQIVGGVESAKRRQKSSRTASNDRRKTPPDWPAEIADLIRNQGYRLILPSEAEWEKAARGPEGRLFPWGEKPEMERANYDDTKIGSTNAVGCFPGGSSIYGVEEMSGNVWEWTRSLWGSRKDDKVTLEFGYPYDPTDGREDLRARTDVLRVLRGGSFGNNEKLARCAIRLRVIPGSRYNDYGFRVVCQVVPILTSAL